MQKVKPTIDRIFSDHRRLDKIYHLWLLEFFCVHFHWYRVQSVIVFTSFTVKHFNYFYTELD